MHFKSLVLELKEVNNDYSRVCTKKEPRVLCVESKVDLRVKCKYEYNYNKG